jgi:hypothetical protein
VSRTRSSLLPLVVALLAVTAGCVTPPLASDPAPDPERPPGEWTFPQDPRADRIGWEAGYWHNESIDVDQSDGLSEAELSAFVARTMARVEHIRGLEFDRSVPVEVLTREEYRQTTTFARPSDAFDEQVWEAQFLVGEDELVNETFDTLYGGNVLGYYSPGEEAIVLVSDSEDPVIDRGTLAHELLHALQDQTFGLPPGQATRDGDLARDGLVEGDARYVEQVYQQRCRAGVWECVPTPPRESSGGPRPNQGVLRSVLFPYSDGPTLVHRLLQRSGSAPPTRLEATPASGSTPASEAAAGAGDGPTPNATGTLPAATRTDWAPVNDAYGRVPASTEQVIHPEKYPDEPVRRVVVPDRSDAAWRPVAPDRTERLGEASLYVMLLEHHVIDTREFRSGTGPYSYYNYSHPRTDGWAGDTIVPYTDGESYGYVWAIEFDTVEDAERFRSSYHLMLALRIGGKKLDATTYVVDRGPYADAFRLTREGDRVVIVNAPDRAALDRVHRPSSGSA